MSSDRRILSSRANGRLSNGPITAAGKLTSSQDALRHGHLARYLVLEDESIEAFQALLAQHIDRLQPADSLELGMIEDRAAAMWRMRRSWAIETHWLDTVPLDRITAAFSALAAASALPLNHRLRAAVPNEPSPISGHSVDVLP